MDGKISLKDREPISGYEDDVADRKEPKYSPRLDLNQ
jgi:hypothetical protein